MAYGLRFTVIILAAIGLTSKAQNNQFIPCPEKEPVWNFNMTKLLGQWYLTELCINTESADGYKCTDMEFTREGQKYGVTVSQNNSKWNGDVDFINSEDVGYLRVQVPILLGLDIRNYYILDTDYVTYAAFWTCYNDGHTREGDVYVRDLKRKKNPSYSALKEFEKQGSNLSHCRPCTRF
ncbi:lazarillo protein-like [Periplaneta americana]|uniref:lazarillo protein-like n=1 Tax=Periplaneta americana TaxID=6978 RepID=UPI0037E81420